jgi:excisionase family DNA binding protein
MEKLMTEQLQYFNSEQAAKILGVNVSTIKRWTDEGKLQCVRSAGGHRKFLFYHLSGFLEKNTKKRTKLSLFPVEDVTDLQITQHIIKGEFEYLKNFLLETAFACDRKRILQVLQGLYMSQFPLHQIFDELVTPVLHRIGDMWEDNRITVTEEHIASQTLRDCLIRLQAVICIPSEKIGNVICLNFSDELHDIALKMADHILESFGYKVLFSGQITPQLKIDQIFKTFQPERVYISSKVVKNPQLVQEELDQICALCKDHGSQLYLGGEGFSKLDTSHESIIEVLNNHTELYNSLTYQEQIDQESEG